MDILFNLYNTCIGIDITESEIFFMKIARTSRGYKKKFELRKTYSPAQDLVKTIQETTKKYHLKSTYCAVNFFTTKFLVKIVDLPKMPFNEIDTYLTANPELYLSVKNQKDHYFIRYLVDQHSAEKIRVLKFISKKSEIDHSITNVHAIANLSFLAFNDMITLLMVPKFHSPFSGWHLHLKLSYLFVLNYKEGHLNSFQMYDSSRDYQGELSSLGLYSPCSHPVLITGEVDTLYSLNIPNVQTILLSNMNIDCQNEFFTALCCSLMPFLNLVNSDTSTIFPPEQRFFRKKLQSILFKSILILYLSSLCIFLTVWITRIILTDKTEEIKNREIHHQSLLSTQNQLLIEQNQLKESLLKYQSYINQKNRPSIDLYRLVKCIPQNLCLSKLEMKANRTNSNRIFLKGFSRSENEVIEFLNNLELNSKFFQVSLENFQLKKLLNNKKHLPKGRDWFVEFQVRIDT